MNKKDIINTLSILKSQKLIKSYSIRIEKVNKDWLLYKIWVLWNKYKTYFIDYIDYNNHKLNFSLWNDIKIDLKNILYSQILSSN